MTSATPAPATPADTPTLTKSDQNLVWIDCEMSGLDPEKERLLEIAVIITGPNLTPRIEGPVLVIHQSDAVLGAMDNWNKGTHGRSGLIDKVRASTLTEEQAQAQLLQGNAIARQHPRAHRKVRQRLDLVPLPHKRRIARGRLHGAVGKGLLGGGHRAAQPLVGPVHPQLLYGKKRDQQRDGDLDDGGEAHGAEGRAKGGGATGLCADAAGALKDGVAVV